MRIDSLTVSNFKNFAQETVAFSPGVNLFVGGNGTGKTSILEAVNIAIGGFFASQGSRLSRYISFDEIRIAEGIRQAEASVTGQSDLVPGSGWTRTIRRDTKSNDLKGVNPIGLQGKVFFSNYFEDPDDRHIAPLIAYYSTQRLFKDSSISEKQKYDAANGRRNGYLQCLRETAIKGVLNDWLGNAVTRRATMLIKDIQQTDHILENVETAIERTLVMFLEHPPEYRIKIYQDPDFNNEIFVNYDSEHNLPLAYYSDGFRNLVYLIFDLVWRASQLNPWLSLNDLSQKVSGVVTIDEIDLHLHPRWQTKAVKILQHLFPNVQFFITTHSPTVVANFENGTLYTIKKNAFERHPADFFGRQVNDVLRNILDSPDRHKPTQDLLNELFHLIESNSADRYEPLLQRLIDQLGLDDPEIQKALTLIDMRDLNTI